MQPLLCGPPETALSLATRDLVNPRVVSSGWQRLTGPLGAEPIAVLPRLAPGSPVCVCFLSLGSSRSFLCK